MDSQQKPCNVSERNFFSSIGSSSPETIPAPVKTDVGDGRVEKQIQSNVNTNLTLYKANSNNDHGSSTSYCDEQCEQKKKRIMDEMKAGIGRIEMENDRLRYLLNQMCTDFYNLQQLVSIKQRQQESNQHHLQMGGERFEDDDERKSSSSERIGRKESSTNQAAIPCRRPDTVDRAVVGNCDAAKNMLELQSKHKPKHQWYVPTQS